MPKGDPLVPAHDVADFDTMRRRAMLAHPTDALIVEHNDLAWADFGRRIYANIEDRERFLKAIVTALFASEGTEKPQSITASSAARASPKTTLQPR